MNPHCKIVHYCDNVMKPEFGVPFVSKFDIVMNALDNLGARRHMNRLCLAADKPLIESGTTGYLGQVSVHLPHKTECFECTEKPTPKTYLHRSISTYMCHQDPSSCPVFGSLFRDI